MTKRKELVDDLTQAFDAHCTAIREMNDLLSKNKRIGPKWLRSLGWDLEEGLDISQAKIVELARLLQPGRATSRRGRPKTCKGGG